MSGLVDIWTSEVAKLREKGQNFSLFSRDDASATSTLTPSTNPDEANLEAGRSPSGWSKSNNLAAIWQAKKIPALHYSEVSVSMLVDCFSP